ncbi:hypothetical protein LCGC14_3056540, partial [marine sediment metagenome]
MSPYFDTPSGKIWVPEDELVGLNVSQIAGQLLGGSSFESLVGPERPNTFYGDWADEVVPLVQEPFDGSIGAVPGGTTAMVTALVVISSAAIVARYGRVVGPIVVRVMARV